MGPDDTSFETQRERKRKEDRKKVRKRKEDRKKEIKKRDLHQRAASCSCLAGRELWNASCSAGVCSPVADTDRHLQEKRFVIIIT